MNVRARTQGQRSGLEVTFPFNFLYQEVYFMAQEMCDKETEQAIGMIKNTVISNHLGNTGEFFESFRGIIWMRFLPILG
eukprot:c14558_g1_i1 orf=180-416(+)